MNHKNLKVIILAAGRGSRLMPLTEKMPKCLVPVAGKPILYYQLKALEMNELKKIAIVVGYRAAMVEKYVKENFSQFDAEFIFNAEYETTGPFHSFLLVKNIRSGATLQIMGDALFHPNIIAALLQKSMGKSITCLRRGICGEEEMKAEVSGNMVRSLGKTLLPEKTAGEFVGISLFTGDFSKKLSEILIEPAIGSERFTHYIGDAAHKIIQESIGELRFFYADEPIMEIDFPGDIEFAESNIVPIISQYIY